MLDRNKLLHELAAIRERIFPLESTTPAELRHRWEQLCTDELFAVRVLLAQDAGVAVKWYGALDAREQVASLPGGYGVLAVDGSQIYPDRHMPGAQCFLINVGGVMLSYGKSSRAELFSHPIILLPEDVAPAHAGGFSKDLVDLKREECEFVEMVARARQSKLAELPLVCFMDGTLLFWHLESKPPEVRAYYFQQYVHAMAALYQDRFLYAGYISMPKSRDLATLLKLSLCRCVGVMCLSCYEEEGGAWQFLDRVLDMHIVTLFLAPGERTDIFWPTSQLTRSYPAPLRPAFFYIHAEKEIVRIEVPAWIAEDVQLVNLVAAAALDQSRKGGGYPVCLAEAHEQAVVKGPDRDFFYHVVCKISIEQQRRVAMSQKSIKKRGIGI